ncbi:uncharacterized protein LOC126812106 [Patella vulgata]|uniref:uncharacterized protein LOC126812106 n=1 Tax=Patella vulgata TaxID=6465 RepID=UPI0024A7F25C|nr:uncharacterized protein LOC126812106 [Patella vulgata]
MRRLELLVVVGVFLFIFSALYINLNIDVTKKHDLKYRKKHFKDVFFHKEVTPQLEPELAKDWLENDAEPPISWRRKGKKRKRRPRRFHGRLDETEDTEDQIKRRMRRKKDHRPGQKHKKKRKRRTRRFHRRLGETDDTAETLERRIRHRKDHRPIRKHHNKKKRKSHHGQKRKLKRKARKRKLKRNHKRIHNIQHQDHQKADMGLELASKYMENHHIMNQRKVGNHSIDHQMLLVPELGSKDIENHHIMNQRKVGNHSNDHQMLLVPDEAKEELHLEPKHPRWFRGQNRLYNRHSFRRKMTKTEILLVMQTVKKFEELMRKHGIIYFMSVRTLLGSYRHHGFIPWDENIDFVLPRKNQEQVFIILKLIEPEYSLYREKNGLWKLYFWQSRSFGKEWKWPYVGLWFYDSNNTHIWNIEPYAKINQVYPMIDIFPLKTRPFLGMSLPAPNQDSKLVQKSFDLSKCSSPGYDYKRGVPVESTTIDCDALQNKFPFVKRHDFGHGNVNETLMFNGQVIGWFVIK